MSTSHAPFARFPRPEKTKNRFPLCDSVGVARAARLAEVFSMTLRKADGAELGLNVKPLDEAEEPESAGQWWGKWV